MKTKKADAGAKRGNFYGVPVPIMDSETFHYALNGLLRSFHEQSDDEWIATHLRTLSGPDNLQTWSPR